MKFEIEIDLRNLEGRVKPLAVRSPRKNEYYLEEELEDGSLKPDYRVAQAGSNRKDIAIIVELLEPECVVWDKWPSWLKGEAMAYDEEGGLYLYQEKPILKDTFWYAPSEVGVCLDDLELFSDCRKPMLADGGKLILNPHKLSQKKRDQLQSI